ncbi:hypothetical protein R4U68_005413 [Raoultella ornithinolytica]|nr:hypothetical protein [Raoultella ornithinolytica]
MTTIAIKIEAVSGSIMEFSRQSETWGSLNQYERDDIISAWVNESSEAQRALTGSTGYLLSWKSE